MTSSPRYRPLSQVDAVALRALGTVCLANATGEPIQSLLAQPKRLALAIYLACHPRGTFHPRDSLLSLFWPDFDDERARNSMRTALHYMGRSLGPGVVVIRADGAVGVDPRRLWTDVWAYESAIEGDDWGTAIELYRGDFLDGFSSGLAEVDAWIEQRRGALRRRFSHVLWRRSEEQEAAADLTGAILTLQQGLQLFPANELMLRRLIVLMIAAGERASALRLLEEFCRDLEEKFDIEPAPETLEIKNLLHPATTKGRGGTGAQEHKDDPAHSPEPEAQGPMLPPEDGGSGDTGRGRWMGRARASTCMRRVGLSSVAVMAVLVSLFALRRAPVSSSPVPHEPRIMLVMPFSYHGPPDGEYHGGILTHLVAGDLQRQRGWILLPVVSDGALHGSGLAELFDHSRELAHEVGAHVIVLGNVSVVDSAVRVSAAVYEVGERDLRPISSASVDGPVVDLLGVSADLTRSLAASTGTTAKAAENGPEAGRARMH